MLLQSYLVYSTILLSIIASSFLLSKGRMGRHSNLVYTYSYWKIAAIPIVVYTFFNGFRYDVGVDSYQYWAIFERMQMGLVYRDIDSIEFGYYWLNRILVGCGFEPYSILILTSFVFIYSYLFLLKDQRYILFYTLPLYALYMFQAENLVRQFFACGILLIGLHYLFHEKKYYYWILGCVAFSIHSTVLFGIVVYWIFYRWKYNINRNVILSLYIVTAIIGVSILSYLETPLTAISFLGNYGIKDNYFNSISNLINDSRVGLYGGRSLLNTFFIHGRSLFLIIYGYSLLKKNKTGFYHFVYYVTILSFILDNLFYTHELFGRLNMYFDVFYPILAGYVAYDVLNRTSYKYKRISLIFIILIYMHCVYSYTMAIGSMNEVMGHPFSFYWERDMIISRFKWF